MSTAKSVPSGFQWPWQYHFPPFFTIQPNSDTQAKQIEAWCELVLAYHKAAKSYILDVNEAQSSPLFYNRKINRILHPFHSNGYFQISSLCSVLGRNVFVVHRVQLPAHTTKVIKGLVTLVHVDFVGLLVQQLHVYKGPSGLKCC